MTCTEYLEGFSDFLDGCCTEPEADAFEAHIASCERCARYTRICQEGTTLLQAFSTAGVDEDFGTRLEHRLHGLENELSVARSMGTGGSTAMVLSIATILLALAWSPLLFVDSVDVELAPITVTRPPARALGLPLPAVTIRPGATSHAALGFDADLWAASDALFREYAPIRQRYRSARPALQQ